MVRSATDESGDRVGGLTELDVSLTAAETSRLDHTVVHVLLEQPEGDSLQRLVDRRDLGQDVDAVGVALNHPGDALDLALDAPQPLAVRLRALRVAHKLALFPEAAIRRFRQCDPALAML